MTLVPSVKTAAVIVVSVLVALSADRLLQAHNLKWAAYGLSTTCNFKSLALQLALKSAELSPLFHGGLPLEIAKAPDC